MKRLAIGLLFFALSSHSIGQIKTAAFKTSDVIRIKLDALVADGALHSNIKGIDFIDLRDDTSSVGYVLTRLPKKYNKICFDTASDYVLRSWFSNYLKINSGTQSGGRLLISLKKLRISNEAGLHLSDNDHLGKPINGWDEGVFIKVEFYLNQGLVYYPLYRFDSLIRIDAKLPNDAAEFITTGLTSALAKLFTLNLGMLPSGIRQLSLQDILAQSEKETTVPVLIDIAYKKGVYKDFDEFKMNSPSILNFEYKKGKKGDVLYVKEADKEYPDRAVWGFCDGKNMFINSGDVFSELIRAGNAFYFFGTKGMKQKTANDFWKSSTLNLVTGYGPKTVGYKMDFTYFQIDMETGEVY